MTLRNLELHARNDDDKGQFALRIIIIIIIIIIIK